MTRNDRPWMRALEMQFAAVLATSRHEPANDSVSWIRGVSRHLRVAECYAFSGETSAAITLASRSIPGSTRMDAATFPTPSGWWWFDTPLVMPGLHQDADRCVALSWWTTGLQVNEHTGKEEPYVGIIGWLAHDGYPWPAFHERLIGHDTLDGLAHTIRSEPATNDEHAALRLVSLQIWRFVLAGCVWIHQRIATVSLGPVERHRRKQLQREAGMVVRDVKVVELRRLESTLREPGKGEPVDWSCRWIVDGHWRNQHHPSTGKHELTFVQPYVKGPADKPLRVPAHTVYLVDR